MAIALDNTSSNADTNTADLTFTHTVTSNTNGILLISFGYTGSAATISSVTYNSVTMTAITGSPFAVLSTYHIGFYYLLLPATGANTVEIKLSLTEDITAGGLSLTGAKQNAPEATNTASSNGQFGLVGGSVTTIAANAWVVDSFGLASGSASLTASQTQYYNQVDSANGRTSAGEYQGPVVTPGSTAQQWTIGGSTNKAWGQILASIAPVAATFIAESNKPILQAVNRAGSY